MNDELRRRRHRHLSDAERTLWSEVTRGVVRLRSTSASGQESERLADMPSKSGNEINKQRVGTAAPAVTGPARTPTPPLVPLGRRMRQRIARGSREIGGRLDLHGLTQREAQDALLRFLRSAQERGVTLALVITGRGAPGFDAGHERGVLKRQVPHWLRLPAFRELIVGFEPAHQTHGGEGALYVRVRRKKES
jgi:DNA-nicking Smr family endonuclease